MFGRACRRGTSPGETVALFARPSLRAEDNELPKQKIPGMLKLSDYLIGFLADRGVEHVFMVTGGGAMHLNESIGSDHRIQYVCNHHEQACAMAAECYARVTGKVGVVNVTTGPGGVNALNELPPCRTSKGARYKKAARA